MKLFKIFLIVSLYFNFIQLNSSENNKVLEIKISKNIRCLICQGQSVYDSQSDFAESVKLIIKQKLDEGKTEAQIYEFLKIQYGEWILYDPDFNKNTFFLWLLPIIVFIGGGWLILKKINFFKL
tara:strand:+ start:1018 stop:1389 length:372 start_codon:yes stop_codon:yes gene_type:complete